MKQVIKDYPNYEITDTGKVLSKYLMGELVQRVGKKGYAYVNLYNEHGRKTKKIHRLVAETFIPNPNNFPMVNHKDGNKLNNRVDNLEWCTPSENIQHAVRTGLINYFTELRRETSINNGKKGRSRKVKAMQISTGHCKYFDSATEFAKFINSPIATVTPILRKGKCIKGYQVWYTDTLATTMDEEP